MNITALLHVLLMANLVGLLTPEVLLARQYRSCSDMMGKAAIAKVHMQLVTFAFFLVPLVVLTGVGRVMEAGYPWFAFGTLFWLAAKQTLGLFLLVWIAVNWTSVRRTRKSLDFKDNTSDALRDDLRNYERIRGRSHVVTGLAGVLLVLAVLKP